MTSKEEKEIDLLEILVKLFSLLKDASC